MEKNWVFRQHDEHQVSELESSASVPPVVAKLLVQRGITSSEDVRSFLDVKLTGLRDPEELPGALEAARLIYAAAKDEKRIIIYGDYDADGMTGTSIFYRCLKLIGADVGYYVPNRMEEGYGLNIEAIDRLASQGAELLITVDCGIASVEEAAHAKQLGLQLVVTDHHQYGETLPDADVLVHPSLPDSDYPFAGLCGSAVAFKVAWSICKIASDSDKVSPRLREFLLTAVGIAAIGTVADVVPLLDENRVIVTHGLISLKQRPPEGLKALMRVAGSDKKQTLGSEDIGFAIGPRLNAAGRLGQAQLGVELLTTDDPDRAVSLAEYLDQLNKNRSSLERSVYLAATKQIKENYDAENDPALVLAGQGWHPGVIGVVAGRIAEKYHRPTVIIALDQVGVKPGSGSGRSAGMIDLHKAFGECTEYLLKHGGHAAAAGLTIEENQVDAFRSAFCDVAQQMMDEQDRQAEVIIDAEVPLSQL
ncbi:MAG TPA: single-stranded-DNA-specific exonuclease RecJ, partial [Planctomycetaceae bacterium]|nr:single-stranded-DNA-specific exonuclease RecJ [Planctomycetaceae bacterium]